MNHQYRVTKYNPKHRDKKQGNYLKDEWTSVSDIGEKFGEIILDEDEYFTVEKAYIRVFLVIN